MSTRRRRSVLGHECRVREKIARVDRGLEVRIEERRDRQTLVVIATDDAMPRRAEHIICPALKQIAYIDDERARNGRDFDPVAIESLDFKAAGRVLAGPQGRLIQKGQAAIIRVRREAEFIRRAPVAPLGIVEPLRALQRFRIARIEEVAGRSNASATAPSNCRPHAPTASK